MGEAPSRARRRRGEERLRTVVFRDYRRLSNPLGPLTILSEDEVEHIHSFALRLLGEHGIRVLLPEARERFGETGAAIDQDSLMVRLDPEAMEQALSFAPSSFDIFSRNPERDLTFGGRSVAFVPVSGPPHATDLDRGRRPGTLSDFVEMTRLTQSFDVLHLTGATVEPMDVPPEFRHLEMAYSAMTDSDKVPFVYARGNPQVVDCFEMIRLANGVTVDEFRERPFTWSVINSNSPRQLDIPMCQGIIDFATAGQVLVITPFTLAGAMAPVTIKGALVLQHAEAIAGIALAQIVNPGTPVMYGAFTSNVDMRSGSPAFGTPEYVKASIAAGQLARRLGLPWRSSGPTSSNAPDVQGAYETMMSLFGALMGGANMVLHAAGWLEGGLAASYEKLITDVEVLQMYAESFSPLDQGEAEYAWEALVDVQPGGHFFGTPHTMERYANAFYSPLVSDWSNYGLWAENGSLDATQRANRIWRKVLDEFEQPPFDSDRLGALTEFKERRIREGGAHPVS